MLKLLFLFIISLPPSVFSSTLLVVGDSHTVGPFGRRLDENLRKEGHKVSTFASCGSIAGWWYTGKKTTCGYLSIDESGKLSEATQHTTPLIENLLSEIRPDIVLVAFGSNYVKTPSDEFVKKDLQKLLTSINASGAKCFWITPPDMRLYRKEIPRIKKLIEETVHCALFDSETVTKYPETGGDGVHYWSAKGTPIAKAWADAVVQSLMTRP
ncbi:SGNH/GDSL hydrolase family protein [Peredibacter starrii]|uniref:SGNH/GDSL hydrolase family protein n=1 Tax=Peredibacter starrii TaxID=28202 RepID=A0AAX4HSY2_9BACT|nr:SGNH/GDSL hydrolase family protein [Peredibacter starrii]WPU66075.1 SGNH/GDSL hydrolase family protein [Peredibacter starrii]